MNPLQFSCGCSCSAGPKLIFSCSGAADLGFEKGSTEVNCDSIAQVVDKARIFLS